MIDLFGRADADARVCQDPLGLGLAHGEALAPSPSDRLDRHQVNRMQVVDLVQLASFRLARCAALGLNDGVVERLGLGMANRDLDLHVRQGGGRNARRPRDDEP